MAEEAYLKRETPWKVELGGDLGNQTRVQRKEEMPSRKHESVLAYLLKDLNQEGVFYYVDCVDVTDKGLIFAVDPILVKEGIFADKYIDSRYLDEMGLELILVPYPPDLEQ